MHNINFDNNNAIAQHFINIKGWELVPENIIEGHMAKRTLGWGFDVFTCLRESMCHQPTLLVKT